MQMGYDFEMGQPATNATADWRARLGLAVALAPTPERAASSVPEPEAAPLRQPEWAGLKARFQAMHALQLALAQDFAARPALTTFAGSFAAVGPSVLSSCRNGTAVNPVYWGNSKALCAKVGTAAAAPIRGDRGPA